MGITIKQTLLNNQSILENIALVEEIDEQAAEIISGGKSVNLLNKKISAFEETEPENPEDPTIDPDEPGNDGEPPLLPANLASFQDRSWRGSNRNRYF